MLGLSACVYLPLRVFSRISELLSIWRSNIVTEDRFHKILVEVSKADKSRQCTWVEIATTGNFTCPHAYLKDGAY